MKVKSLDKIISQVDRLFAHELYDYGYFETQLDTILEKARALWFVLAEDLVELFISIMQDVDEAFSDG